MDITFACRCGIRIRIGREAAGRQCRCPTCYRRLLVPDLGVILRLNPDLPVVGSQARLKIKLPGPARHPGLTEAPEILRREASEGASGLADRRLSRAGGAPADFAGGRGRAPEPPACQDRR